MQPLRTSLFRTATRVTIVGLVLLTTLAIGTELSNTRQQLASSGHLIAELLKRFYVPGDARSVDLAAAASALTSTQDGQQVCLYDERGRVLDGVALGRAACDEQPTLTQGDSWRTPLTHTERIANGDHTLGWLTLSIGRGDMYRAMVLRTLAIVAAALLLAVAGILLASSYARRLGAEVQRIGAAAAAMRADKLPSTNAHLTDDANTLDPDDEMSIAEFAELQHAIDATAQRVRERIEAAEREISDRQRAEAALANSEHRLRRIIDAVPQAVFATSPGHAGREPQLLFVNRSLAQLYGCNIAELLANPGMLFRDPWLSGAPTVVIKAGNGSRVLEVHRVSIPLEADVGGTLVVATDVTEARHLQMQLNQASRTQAIGQLAGGIAHEFNNLLTPISGHAELLKARIADTELHHQVDAITQAAVRARQLIRQLLSFSRNSEPLFERIPTHVAAVVSEVALLMRGSLPSSIELRTQVELGLQTVMADPGQLHQVLVNLCTNAAQAIGGLGVANGEATETSTAHSISGRRVLGSDTGGLVPSQGGRIDIIADVIHAEDLPLDVLERDVNGVRIRVLDNGAGMRPDVMAQVFEPFFSTKTNEQGTGLGLAVAKGIVEAHGGIIRVDSASSRTTCFEIILPGIREPAASTVALAPGAVEPDSSTPPRRSQRVLLVDDDAAVLLVTGEMLRALGYETTTAQNAERALAIMSNPDTGTQVDLVVTDNSMPGMDGNALARKLRAQRPNLPIVMLTGLMEVEPAAPGVINLHLMKPVGLQELERAIGGLLANRAD